MRLPIGPLSFVHGALRRPSPLADDAWATATPMFRYRSFDYGGHIIQSGDIVNDLSFLAPGLTRFYNLDEQGKEFNKSFSQPGQVISRISSLVKGHTRPCTFSHSTT